MVRYGLDHKIDAFLFAGDAYRTSEPSPTEQQIFAECLKPLTDAGVPVVMVSGNHDHPIQHGRATSIDIFSYLGADVHVYRRQAVDTIDTAAGPLQLVLLPWPVRSVLLFGEDWAERSSQDLTQAIEQSYIQFVADAALKLDPAIPTVLIGHFEVHGSLLAGSEQSRLIAHEPRFTPSQLSIPPIDYVALGHIHRHQDCAAAGTVPVVYSGSIERVSFNEAGDPKGFVLVEIRASDNGKNTSYTFVETPARRYVTVLADTRAKPDPTAAVLDAIGRRKIKDAIVRVRYEADDAHSRLDLAAVQKALEPAFSVASIECIQPPLRREKRTEITAKASLKEALEGYIGQHENLKRHERDLVRVALALDREIGVDQPANN